MSGKLRKHFIITSFIIQYFIGDTLCFKIWTYLELTDFCNDVFYFFFMLFQQFVDNKVIKHVVPDFDI